MKKRIFAVLFTVSLVFVIVGCGNIEGGELPPDIEDPNGHNDPPSVIGSGDLSIHFLELGNRDVGDCVYINYGDMDIIIDAGSRQESATTIKKYIDDYIQDNKLEFVIATHAHFDHISGFNTIGSVTGILDAYTIETIIDFPRTDIISATYDRYVNTRQKLKDNGTTKHYTALECYNEVGKAQRVWNLGGDVYLEILYNYYYDHKANTENDYSVCVKIRQGENQYLFTGDLEKSGEDKLVDFYGTKPGGLGRCVLYKGGHHGSYTSSNEKLMAAIEPKYVCVCTCAGTTQYTVNPGGIFPTQSFIERVAIYTDKVYLTTLVTDYDAGAFEPFNGNIVFLVSDGNISINCSNNNLKLKETEWFLLNRILPDAWKDPMP